MTRRPRLSVWVGMLLLPSASAYAVTPPAAPSETESATILSLEQRLIQEAEARRKSEGRDIQTAPTGPAPRVGEYGGHEDIPMAPPPGLKQAATRLGSTSPSASAGPKIITGRDAAPRSQPASHQAPQLGSTVTSAPIIGTSTALSPQRPSTVPTPGSSLAVAAGASDFASQPWDPPVAEEPPLVPPPHAKLAASKNDDLALPEPDPYDGMLPESAFALDDLPRAQAVDAFADYRPDEHVGLRPIEAAAAPFAEPSIVGAMALSGQEDVPAAPRDLPEVDKNQPTLFSIAQKPEFFKTAWLNYSHSTERLEVTWPRLAGKKPGAWLLPLFEEALTKDTTLRFGTGGGEQIVISKTTTGELRLVRGGATLPLTSESFRGLLYLGLSEPGMRLYINGEGRLALSAVGAVADQLRR